MFGTKKPYESGIQPRFQPYDILCLKSRANLALAVHLALVIHLATLETMWLVAFSNDYQFAFYRPYHITCQSYSNSILDFFPPEILASLNAKLWSGLAWWYRTVSSRLTIFSGEYCSISLGHSLYGYHNYNQPTQQAKAKAK